MRYKEMREWKWKYIAFINNVVGLLAMEFKLQLDVI